MKLWQGRFEEDSDPVFEKMNRSLGVDAVLLEVDIRASRAHARSLAGCGVLTQEELKAIDEGLEQILSEYTPEQVKAAPYEDIHTFVEATLASKIGPTAGKLHTGRSRNDQVATDFRLFVRKAIGLILADLEALQAALIESGARYSGFEQSLSRVDILPLGSGAVSGSNFPVDREAVAKELGFAKISANSLDATCDRDFVLEFLSDAAIMMVHASRLAEDWIMYSTEEFGFLELSEKVTTGSSLMPQKKNPDGFEIIRAKAAMTTGLLTGFLGVMKGLPTGYNKDLQEDKEAVLKTFENVRLSLSVLRLSVRTVTLKTDRLEKAASDSFMGATDLADFLVMKGVPFRRAHEIVARAVREALDQKKQLNQIDLSVFSPFFTDLPAGYLTAENIVNRKGHSPLLP